ncbi:hypothetical protein MTsDn1_30080 [Alteromonas sp. MTD1]
MSEWAKADGNESNVKEAGYLMFATIKVARHNTL